MGARILIQNGETWLICGGRHFFDRDTFNEVMDHLSVTRGIPEKVIHGGADGADTLAEEWAQKLSLWRTTYKANWEKYGKGAGPIRNQEMLESGQPDFVVAFPGGAGTADMVRRAKKAGVVVAEIRPAT